MAEVDDILAKYGIKLPPAVRVTRMECVLQGGIRILAWNTPVHGVVSHLDIRRLDGKSLCADKIPKHATEKHDGVITCPDCCRLLTARQYRP